MTTSRKSIPISFEVFPPKKDGEFQTAFATLDKLGALAPAFISVTYGAGGSNSGKTVEIASYIQNRLHLPPWLTSPAWAASGKPCGRCWLR